MQTIQITSALNDSIRLIDNPWFIINDGAIVGVYQNRNQARVAKKEEGIAGKIFSHEHVTLELAYLSDTLPDETISEKDEEELAAAIDAEEVITQDMVPAPSTPEEALAMEDGFDVYGFETNKFINCPNCGTHLSNGIGEHLQEVNDKVIKHKKFKYECLACCKEFGPSIVEGGKSSSEVVVREAQKTSMKLDRTITARSEETDEVLGTWANAFQMYKANPTWMTSGQQDGLTAKLYKAAKAGEKIEIWLNGRIFTLVNVAGV